VSLISVKRSEFIDLLTKKEPRVPEMLVSGVPLTTIVADIGLTMWIDNHDDNTDAQVIKDQIVSLRTRGVWNFNDSDE
jgi:hypothetical protein